MKASNEGALFNGRPARTSAVEPHVLVEDVADLAGGVRPRLDLAGCVAIHHQVAEGHVRHVPGRIAWRGM